MSVSMLYSGAKFLVQLQYLQKAHKSKVHGRSSITGVPAHTNRNE